jgi:hypothetical protein
MGSVGVISKAGATPVYTPGAGFGLQYAVGQSNSAPQQSLPGVNPQGMAGLEQHPVTGEMRAAQHTTPVLDATGNQMIDAATGKPRVENHTFVGDITGAGAVNQMNSRKLKPGQGRASGVVGDTYQRGKLNPMRYLSGQDTGQSAGQVAFDRGSKWGQFGNQFGTGLSTAAGIMGGAVALANAGAQGQDAFSGGLNAFQMGQMARDQTKKPLSEGLGGAAANVAGRSVGVTRPEVASPTPVAVAPPTTTTTPTALTAEEMEESRRMASDTVHGGNYNVGVMYSGRDASQNMHPADDYHGPFSGKRIGEQQQHDWNTMGMPPANFTGTIGNQTPVAPATPEKQQWSTGTPVAGAQLDFYGNAAQSQNQQIPGINEPPVTADATTSGNTIGAATGQKQLVGAPDPTESGKIIDENINAAKKTDTTASMVSQGIGKMVGVIGSKRMVGVY